MSGALQNGCGLAQFEDLRADERAVDEQRDLVGKLVRVSYLQTLGYVLQPALHFALVIRRHLACWMVGLGELRSDVDLRATAIVRLSEPIGDPCQVGIEFRLRVVPMFFRHMVPRVPEVPVLTLEECSHKVVLGTKMTIETGLGHSCFLDHEIHPHGADTSLIEQSRCGLDDSVPHVRAALGSSVDCTHGIRPSNVVNESPSYRLQTCLFQQNRQVCSIQRMSKPPRSHSDRSVAVFGASGHTGRFVVSELLRRGIAPIAVGRDGVKMAEPGFADRGIEVRAASIEDAPSLDRAFDGASAVVNCAGPFLDTAEAVVAAALRTGIHYLDLTAEQASARATFDHFDEPARSAGVVVMPAMGFYGGFADLLVTAAMDDWNVVDDIMIGIALDSWLPTPGTRLTGERNTARRMVVMDGKLAPVSEPPGEMEWDFPDPFAWQRVVELPLSEIVVIDRHTRTSELRTYLSHNALQDVRDPTTPPPGPADQAGRSAQAFLVEAIVMRGDQKRRIAVKGQDIYAFSAPLVCEAVSRILEGGAQNSGAQAPGAIFDARDFLDTLVQEHAMTEVAAD